MFPIDPGKIVGVAEHLCSKIFAESLQRAWAEIQRPLDPGDSLTAFCEVPGVGSVFVDGIGYSDSSPVVIVTGKVQKGPVRVLMHMNALAMVFAVGTGGLRSEIKFWQFE